MAYTFSKICVFCRIRGHVITKCPQIDSEVRDGFVRHVGEYIDVGQQMLDGDSIEQPKLKNQVQNNVKR